MARILRRSQRRPAVGAFRGALKSNGGRVATASRNAPATVIYSSDGLVHRTVGLGVFRPSGNFASSYVLFTVVIAAYLLTEVPFCSRYLPAASGISILFFPPSPSHPPTLQPPYQSILRPPNHPPADFPAFPFRVFDTGPLP